MRQEPTAASFSAAAGAITEELDRMEVTAGKIGMNSPAAAFALLRRMDVVYEKIEQLEPETQSRKTAETQFELVRARLLSETGLFLRDLGGTAALRRERDMVQPPASHDWWYLDELQTSRRRNALRRALITAGAAVLVLAVLAVIYQNFLAPDPMVVAVYGREQTARDALFNGDYETALVSVDEGLDIDPQNASLLVLRGVVLSALGREAEAEQAYQQARPLFAAEEEFFLTRGQSWVYAGQSQNALEDAQAALQVNPDSAQAHLLSGQANEVMGRYDLALDDYDRAYDAAEKAGQSELAAVTRTRMAMLMQIMNARMLPDEGMPTPTP
jgi:Flp pilus assembly protein TadD